MLNISSSFDITADILTAYQCKK